MCRIVRACLDASRCLGCRRLWRLSTEAAVWSGGGFDAQFKQCSAEGVCTHFPCIANVRGVRTPGLRRPFRSNWCIRVRSSPVVASLIGGDCSRSCLTTAVVDAKIPASKPPRHWLLSPATLESAGWGLLVSRRSCCCSCEELHRKLSVREIHGHVLRSSSSGRRPASDETINSSPRCNISPTDPAHAAAATVESPD